MRKEVVVRVQAGIKGGKERGEERCLGTVHNSVLLSAPKLFCPLPLSPSPPALFGPSSMQHPTDPDTARPSIV